MATTGGGGARPAPVVYFTRVWCRDSLVCVVWRLVDGTAVIVDTLLIGYN